MTKGNYSATQYRFFNALQQTGDIDTALKLASIRFHLLGQWMKNDRIRKRIDDILDATDGSNRDEGKATYPGIHGLEKSRDIAHRLMEDARRALSPLGHRARLLLDFCDYLETRSY